MNNTFKSHDKEDTNWKSTILLEDFIPLFPSITKNFKFTRIHTKK